MFIKSGEFPITSPAFLGERGKIYEHEKAQKENLFLFVLLLAVILVSLFIFIPTVNVFRMSLYRMGGITNKQTFIGFENFKTLMGDKNFLQAMQNSILIIVLVTILHNCACNFICNIITERKL